MSDDIAGVLFRHQNRIKEIADVLARYGFARLADHAAAAANTGLRATLVARIADPDLAALTSGQRLRGAEPVEQLPELLQHIGDRRFEELGLSGEVVEEGAKPDVGLARARVNA